MGGQEAEWPQYSKARPRRPRRRPGAQRMLLGRRFGVGVLIHSEHPGHSVQRAAVQGRVADQLQQLQEATGADELLITAIARGHTDRVRWYELPA
jgi:hypothetical protein